MYGFGLILVLAVVGGLIAYFGDRIGMKVGKKRLTLFGLRPKHTGVLITIVTGIFIAISSITVLAIVSQDVRTALFRMKAIQEALVNSQWELEESMVRFGQLETSLATIESDRDQATSELLEVQLEKAVVLQEFEQIVEDLEATKEELEHNQQRVKEFQEMIVLLELRAYELEEWLVFLLEQYESLDNQYGDLWEQYLRFQGGDLVFKADEIIHAQVFQAGGSFDEVSAKLLEFLREAEQIALGRGAQIDEEGESALKLGQQTFEMAVHGLRLQSGYFVVRAISKSNTLMKEPVVTYLEIIPNERVFRKGDVIVEDRLDVERFSEMDRAIMLLIQEANQIAIQEGMITQEGAAIEVPLGSFLNALAQASELRQVTVQIFAIEDTWTTVGPAQLDIRILP